MKNQRYQLAALPLLGFAVIPLGLPGLVLGAVGIVAALVLLFRAGDIAPGRRAGILAAWAGVVAAIAYAFFAFNARVDAADVGTAEPAWTVGIVPALIVGVVLLVFAGVLVLRREAR